MSELLGLLAWLMPLGILLALAGAAVSTFTVEAPPGHQRKRPISHAAKFAANATALSLIVLGVLCLLAGAAAGIASEVLR